MQGVSRLFLRRSRCHAAMRARKPTKPRQALPAAGALALAALLLGAVRVNAENTPMAEWQTESNPDQLTWLTAEDAHGTLLETPALANGQSLALRSPPLAYKPWHRYRLTIQWRGGLFYYWGVRVRYRLADGQTVEQPLFPGRHGAAPAPNWETRRLEFITPSDATQACVMIAASGERDKGHRPAVRDVRIEELGPEPLAGDRPGPRPPRAVSAEELATRGGARGYLRRDGIGRHILNQAQTVVEGAGVVLASIWARGSGRLRLTARLYTAGRNRFFDAESPEWTLTDEWREYSWEAPILFAGLSNIHAQILADVTAAGPVELDEPMARAIQSSRPPPLALPPAAVEAPRQPPSPPSFTLRIRRAPRRYPPACCWAPHCFSPTIPPGITNVSRSSLTSLLVVNFVVNCSDPDFIVNIVEYYIGLVHDKVHEAVIRQSSRRSKRGSSSSPAQHTP